MKKQFKKKETIAKCVQCTNELEWLVSDDYINSFYVCLHPECPNYGLAQIDVNKYEHDRTAKK